MGSPDNDLKRREASFWDRQEEVIDQLYERPHDWRFTPLADRISRPKLNYLVRMITPHFDEVRSILDIGCGNGWLCHFTAEFGVHAIGVDLSANKIETARRIAEERGLGKLCRFEAGDVFDLQLDEKVDVLMAQGSLHHFPDLEEALPRLVEKYLRPGGLMLFAEPHYEGMPPGWARFLLRLARTPIIGKTFDIEFYQQVHSGERGAAESGTGENVRGESPAGLEFLGDDPDMGEILKSRYELLDERFFHYISGHLTNAFYVYQKSRLIRGFYRVALPLVVALDNLLCRRPRYNRYAEEGAWFLRATPPRGDRSTEK